MKSIEEIKKEILLKIMSGRDLSWEYGKTLPIDDELRTFMCELGSKYSYRYARFIDKCPHEETRKEACKDPKYAYWYASYVDKCSREETRKASYRDPRWKFSYKARFGE